MKLSHQDYEHVSVLTLSGEFTSDDVEQFKRTITDRKSGGVRDLVLDCEHLEFIDSAGLETLLHIQEQVGEIGGQLRLVNLDDSVKKILQITRLDLAFESHKSVEAAVRSLR